MTIVGVFLGAVLAVLGLYQIMALPVLVGMVFFAVFLFARMFEMLQEMEARNKRSYEEIQRIYDERFGKKKTRKKKVKKA